MTLPSLLIPHFLQRRQGKKRDKRLNSSLNQFKSIYFFTFHPFHLLFIPHLFYSGEIWQKEQLDRESYRIWDAAFNHADVKEIIFRKPRLSLCYLTLPQLACWYHAKRIWLIWELTSVQCETSWRNQQRIFANAHRCRSSIGTGSMHWV